MAGNLPRACGHCVNCDSVKEDDIMTTLPWRPISPLPLQPAHNFSRDDELRRKWLNHRTRAQDAGLAALQQFEQQLHRSWAIETGIIEGLYRLDEAQTLTLIEHGFEPSAIPSCGTDQDPDNLLAILRDHLTALDALRAQAQPQLSHQPLRNPPAPPGNRRPPAHPPGHEPVRPVVRRPPPSRRLQAGAFKTLPNNPTRPDGFVHQYCPREHVDSELDNLLNWYDEYVTQPDVYHPILVAAWLHHRFAQIHPFQNGNVRVTRALVTWRLVQHDHLPIVVTRDDRSDYIDALEAADDGDLTPLVAFTARLHRRSVLQTVSV